MAGFLSAALQGPAVSPEVPRLEFVRKLFGDCPDFRAAKMGLSSSENGKLFLYRPLAHMRQGQPTWGNLVRAKNPEDRPNMRSPVC